MHFISVLEGSGYIHLMHSSDSGKVIGKISDILVNVTSQKPEVIALKVKKGGETLLLDYSGISVAEEKGQYIFRCNDQEKTLPDTEETSLYLKKQLFSSSLQDEDTRIF